jgi:tripartite-type tricarboxylate transporter receptor subunit TctC
VVAKAAPDGYTLLTSTQGTLVFLRFLYSKLPFDPQRDLAPVSLMANSVVALFVHESVPAKNLKELVAYAKANPGKLNYGSAGVGQPFHLAMELFNQITGTKMVHIPYKGNAQFFPDFVAGRLDMIFYPAVEQLLTQVKAGKLRALAAATEQRISLLPDVPTFAELGVRDFVLNGWIASAVPAATPKEIVARLSREIGRALTTPAVVKFYAELNMIPASSTPEGLARIVQGDSEKWGGLITSLGIKAE